MDTQNATNIALELDDATAQDLTRLAQERGLSLQQTVEAAIRFYLEEDRSYQAFLKKGDEALDHYKCTGLHLTNEEVGAWIAELEAGNDDAELPPCHV